MISYVISTIALILIAVTMLFRANDLRWRKELKWQVRLVGFIMSGAMPIGIIGTEIYYQVWPTPYEALFRVGLALVFVTTPQLPPWWRWVSGKEEANDTN